MARKAGESQQDAYYRELREDRNQQMEKEGREQAERNASTPSAPSSGFFVRPGSLTERDG